MALMRALRLVTLLSVVSAACAFGFFGADMPGCDLQTTNTNSDTNCAIACDNNPSCVAWSWDTSGSGNCWLKSCVSNRVAVNNRVSGVKVGQVGVDRIGGDMSGMPLNLGSATPSACAAQCQATAGCVAWAFDSCGKSSCWLKSSIPTSTAPNSCRVSAIQGTYNIDSPGADISHVVLSASATATDCNTQCLNTPGCSSWAMVQPGVGCELTNDCWLKSSTSLSTNTNNCRVSGVIGGASGTGSSTSSSSSSGGGGGGSCGSGPLATLRIVNNVAPCSGWSYAATTKMFWTNYQQANLNRGDSRTFMGSDIPNLGLGIQENGEYCRSNGNEAGCVNPDNAGMQLVLTGGCCTNYQLNDPFYCGVHPPNAKSVVQVSMSGNWPNCVATLTRLPNAPGCSASC